MSVKLPTKNLLRLCNKAQAATSNDYPFLRINVKNNVLKVAGTDQNEKTVVVWENVECEDFEMLMKGQTIIDTLSGINHETVSFKLKGNKVEIKGGKKKAIRPVFTYSDFPQLKTVKGSSFLIKGSALIEGLKKVIPFVGTDELKANASLCFDIRTGKVELASIDETKNILITYAIPCEISDPKKISLNQSSGRLLKDVLASGETKVTYSSRKIMFKSSNQLVIITISNNKFVDYDRLFGMTPTISFSLNQTQLKNSLKFVGDSVGKNNCLEVVVGDKVNIKTVNKESELFSEDDLEAEFTLQGQTEFAVMFSRTKQMLNMLKGRVKFEYTGHRKPIYITSDDEGFKALVVPREKESFL